MPLTFKDGGGNMRVIKKLRQMQADGTLRNMATLKVKDAGGTLRTVATFTSPLSLRLSTTYSYTVGYLAVITSASVTATPSGGTAPYTYAWTRTSGSCGISSPTSAVTAFNETSISAGQDRISTCSVTVTDSAGQTATASLTVEIVRDNGGFA